MYVANCCTYYNLLILQSSVCFNKLMNFLLASDVTSLHMRSTHPPDLWLYYEDPNLPAEFFLFKMLVWRELEGVWFNNTCQETCLKHLVKIFRSPMILGWRRSGPARGRQARSGKAARRVVSRVREGEDLSSWSHIWRCQILGVWNLKKTGVAILYCRR